MGIAAVVILTFIEQSIFLFRIDLASLHIAFACGVLAMLPVALLLLYLKDALVQGIEYSSLK